MPKTVPIDELDTHNTPPDFSGLEADDAKENARLAAEEALEVPAEAGDSVEDVPADGEEIPPGDGKLPDGVPPLPKTPAPAAKKPVVPAKPIKNDAAVKLSSSKKPDGTNKPPAAAIPGTPAKSQAQATPPVKEGEEVEEPDPEIDALKLDPKYANPVLESQFKQARRYAKTARKEAREYKAQLETVNAALEEAKKAPKVIPEEIKLLQNQVKTLEHYEFLVNPTNSKFITREFDDKITKANDSVFNVLKKYKVPEAKTEKDGVELLSLDFLKRNGGIVGQDYAWWEENVLSKMAPLDRELIKQELIGAMKLEDGKREAILNAAPKREELMKQHEQVREKQTQEAKARVDELVKQNDYVQRKDIPITATAEEKKSLEEHNAFVDYVEQLFPRLVEPASMKHAVDVAAGFVHALYLEKQMTVKDAELAAVQKQVDDLTAELNAIKDAGSTRSETLPSDSTPKKPTSNSDFMHRTVEENFALLED